MTRKTISIIASLAALALLIVGYLYIVPAWMKAHPRRSPYEIDYSLYPESPKLTSFDANKLNRIENFDEGFALVREGNSWRLQSAHLPVDKIKIDQGMILNRLWSVSNVWADAIVDENPEDLSVYGLDDPSGRVLLGDSDGNTVEFIFGNLTPSHNSIYLMLAGDPNIYIISTYTLEYLYFTLDSVRDKDIFDEMNLNAIMRLVIEPRPDDPYGKGTIDIGRRSNNDFMINQFTGFTLNAPYSSKYGANADRFSDMLEALTYLDIIEFVDDDPVSLAPYGLDRPGRLYVETMDGRLEIVYGRGENGIRFARLNGEGSVFTIWGLEPVISVTPFTLLDKFALIFMIDNVDSFTVTGDGRTVSATVNGIGDDAIFHLDGKKAEDKAFRVFYQAVIGLLIDAELNGPELRGEGTDWIVEYKLNTPRGATASIRLIPYNRDFFILEKEGAREFLISRNQARRIFELADTMVYID